MSVASLGKAQRENRNTAAKRERKTNLLWGSKLFNKQFILRDMQRQILRIQWLS
jgi:hypothetical protein